MRCFQTSNVGRRILSDWFDPAFWQGWLAGTLGVEVTLGQLRSLALQLLYLALSCAAALTIRRLTCRRSDALIESIDLRLRPPAVMAALRPLVVVFLWWALVAVAMRAVWLFGPTAPLLHIASSLMLAWMVIHATSGLMRDRVLARLVAMVVWIIAALDILGLLDVVVTALDAIALTFGTVRVSALTVVKGALVLTVLLWAATTAAHGIRLRIARVESLTPSVRVLIANLLKITLVAIAVIIALNSVGIDLSALAVFSGAIGLGLGFGLQKIVSNLISGVILLLDKSIKPGDVIEIEKTFGWITSLGARYVAVRGRDGREYLIPNEDLITHRVTNWSFSSSMVRLDVEFGVAYGSDLRQVRALAIEAARLPQRVLKSPAPVCHVTGFGESAITLVLRFWIEDPTNGVTNVKGDVMLALWDSLKAHGVELPAPQREVRITQLPPVPASAWPQRSAAE
jgi:small-conductance mechanosensitive channel